MILSDSAIQLLINDGKIVIEPFRKECLGTNSYDVHLSKHFAVYTNQIIDAKQDNEIERFIIPKEGFILYPNMLYLGATEEYTETHGCVPFLEGKSSVGRLGIDIHATAGKGDAGFCNFWTLELSTKQPVRIYPGMPIGQLIYFQIFGDINVPYNKKESAKYTKRDHLPMGSAMFKNNF